MSEIYQPQPVPEMDQRVKAVIVNGMGKLLLVRSMNSYPAYSLPGAKLKPGEDFLSSLEQRMKFELGASVNVEEFLGVIENNRRGKNYPYCAVYLGSIPMSTPLAINYTEIRDTTWFSLSAAYTSHLMKFTQDILTMPAIQHRIRERIGMTLAS